MTARVITTIRGAARFAHSLRCKILNHTRKQQPDSRVGKHDDRKGHHYYTRRFSLRSQLEVQNIEPYSQTAARKLAETLAVRFCERDPGRRSKQQLFQHLKTICIN